MRDRRSVEKFYFKSGLIFTNKSAKQFFNVLLSKNKKKRKKERKNKKLFTENFSKNSNLNDSGNFLPSSPS